MGYKRITPQEVKEFHRLYAIHGTYAEVARITGRSASSVKRYVGGESVKSLAKAAYTEFNR
jgi:hypothetical protein